MRWVKAALLLGVCVAAAAGLYVLFDNIAVPAALVLIGVIGACMSVALAGDGSGAAAPDPRMRTGDVPQQRQAPQRQAPQQRQAQYDQQPQYEQPRYERQAPQRHGHPQQWPHEGSNPDSDAWRSAPHGR